MAFPVPVGGVLRDLSCILSGYLLNSGRVQYTAVIVQLERRHDFSRSRGTGRRTDDRDASRIEILSIACRLDGAGVGINMASQFSDSCRIVRAWRVRNPRLARAGRSERRLDRALFSSPGIALLHANRDGGD